MARNSHISVGGPDSQVEIDDSSSTTTPTVSVFKGKAAKRISRSLVSGSEWENRIQVIAASLAELWPITSSDSIWSISASLSVVSRASTSRVSRPSVGDGRWLRTAPIREAIGLPVDTLCAAYDVLLRDVEVSCKQVLSSKQPRRHRPHQPRYQS